ncbi:Mu transposase C-terminal domain-containing protein [Rhodococcus pyridinivorans]|uniref:Mu transposase C-terminal domain-containing protein n=1 Tax=Rhodococcus pyridinivorans TaxID=103816 RepID=UPI00200AAB59|nr:Mu transposase C-terminal domain-containing protein [Rhodococcus pyridinivorans]UPW04844.1 Mu transposase C-terminal domain-containing protein [Rhodococcus pyridinivorans]
MSARGEVRVIGKQQTDDKPAEFAAFTAEEVERVRWWEPHLNEVLYGVSDPDDDTLAPRPGYDDPSKMKRRELKAQELAAAGIHVTVRTLGRKEKQYLAHGVHGLIDRRTTARTTAGPNVDHRVSEAVIAVLEDTLTDSTVSVATLINRVRARLHVRHPQEDIAMPSARTLRRLIDAYDTRGLARGKATTRRSAGNRPDRSPAPISATAPGQVVEIDSTPVNVLCLMPDGKVARPVLTVAMDVATRSILGFSMVPTGASGVEHADLLARILRPRQCRPGAPEWMRLDASDVLPHEQMIALDERQQGALAVPYIVPESITTDRGKDYLGPTFVSACRHFGISVQQAPPQSPTYKTHIERLLGSVDTLWMQKQPGYLGSNPTPRGTISHDGLLTLRELVDSFEQWWVRVWQNRPHDGLRDRDVPSRKFTPNQMYAAMFDASAGIPVPIDEHTYIALMPAHRRVLQPGTGFKINNLTYRSDEIQPLMTMRPGAKDGKWEVHCDPYDPDRAWVAHPETGRWIECVSESYRLDVYPFASALRSLRRTAEARGDVQDEWAEQTLANRPTGLSRKRAARTKAVAEQRTRDNEPRPAPIAAPTPPHLTRTVEMTDEFRVESPDEELWNAT